eukprot:433486-Alexandrium_andersonii.AAC.1
MSLLSLLLVAGSSAAAAAADTRALVRARVVLLIVRHMRIPIPRIPPAALAPGSACLRCVLLVVSPSSLLLPACPCWCLR